MFYLEAQETGIDMEGSDNESLSYVIRGTQYEICSNETQTQIHR